MLVAGASLSLLTPIVAQASDVNLEEMNSYSRSTDKQSSRLDSKTFINEVSEDFAILKGRVDGLETRQNILEAGSFSDTTTLDQKVVFSVGGADFTDSSPDANQNEGVAAQYSYCLLYTSDAADE